MSKIINSDEEFVRSAISKRILERKFVHRGRRYIGRLIRRARRSLLRSIASDKELIREALKPTPALPVARIR